jgi:hypothetical protein
MSINRCLLIAVVIFAVLVPAASAPGANGASTKIVVSLKFPAFHGTLKSPRAGCLGSRGIKLYRQKAGPDKLLGSDRSEDNGKWAIPIGKKRLVSGSYYVTVAARGNCRAAKSNLIPVA